jgi:hypothetical protein
VEKLGWTEIIFDQLKRDFKANPGTPFIIIFMILLEHAGVLLAAGAPDAADNVAIYAFYSLFLGIIAQIGSVVWDGRKHSHSNNNSPSHSP